jgi:hypothetical protein
VNIATPSPASTMETPPVAVQSVTASVTADHVIAR